MDLEVLRKIGLSEGEIKVYEAILEIGISTINKIHEKTGIERRNIYDILNKLIEKGLVTYTIEKGKRTYQITHPNKIISYVEEQEHKLEVTKEDIKKELPTITQIYKAAKPEIASEIFRGKEGMKAVFEDVLNYDEGRFIGGGWYVIEEMPYFWASFNRRRIEKKVNWYNLVKHELKGKPIPEDKYLKSKFLPKEFSGSPIVLFIYGNKVANLLWSKEQFAFVIESKEVADNYRRYFKYLWENVAEG